MSAPVDLSQLSDEELELIASGGSEQPDLSAFSDEELEEIAGSAASAKPSDKQLLQGLSRRNEERLEAEFGRNPYTGEINATPAAFLTNATPEEEEALKRKAREIAPAIISTGLAPLTGGLSLGARAAATGAAAGIGSLGAGAVTGQEAPEAFQDAATNAALYGGGEVLGAGLARGIGAAGKKVLGGLTKPTEEGARAAAKLAEEGAILTPALQSEGRTAKILESLAESSILGSGRISEVRGQAQEAAQGLVERFVRKIGSGLPTEDAGVVVQEALEGRVGAFRAASEELYGKVDDLFDQSIQRVLREAGTVVPAGERVVAEPAVSLTSVKAAARKLLGEAEEGLAGGELKRILKQVATKPGTVSFKGASRLRSDLLKVTRTGTELVGGQAKGAAKKLASLVDDALEATAREAGPEVEKAFRQANEFYRKGAEIFNSKMVRQLAQAQPEAVVAAITKARKPGTIRQIRQAISDPQAWEDVQGTFLRNMLDTSFEASGDIARGSFLSGKKIATKLQNFGDDALKELLGPKVGPFKELVKVLERTQQRTGSGLSGLNIRGGVELYSLGAGNLVLGLTPLALSRILTNPKGIQFLTQGIKAPPGSKQALEAFSRLSGLIAAMEASRPDPASSRDPGPSIQR